MSKFSEAVSILDNLSVQPTTEKLSLTAALNHILFENIVADMNMPPFNKSAMDGYACRKEDLQNTLEVIELVQAGKLPTKKIDKNQCVKIMTGAAVPEGANCVFMVEDSEMVSDKLVKCCNSNIKTNICFKGEDYRKGDILLEKGTRIAPAHIGIIAGAGYAEVLVAKTPVVGILATGTELVEPTEKPIAGQIRNSNSYQLMAQLQSMGVPHNYLGILADNFDQISQRFEDSLAINDIIIITGGASNGDFDFVPAILRSHGFEILFDKTGMQPGNPMTFSHKHQKYCFGLSGNPVSSFVQFELFVKPFIYKLMGYTWQPRRVPGILANDFYRKKPGRFGIIPVKINSDNSIEEIEFNGSAHINALAYANALMEVEESTTQIKKGETVHVRPI